MHTTGMVSSGCCWVIKRKQVFGVDFHQLEIIAVSDSHVKEKDDAQAQAACVSSISNLELNYPFRNTSSFLC